MSRDVDRTLHRWLIDAAVESGMPEAHAAAMAAARDTAQRPGWVVRLRGDVMDTTIRLPRGIDAPLGRAALVGLLILALIAAAIVGVGRQQRRVPPPFGIATNGATIVYTLNGEYLADPLVRGLLPVEGGATSDLAANFSPDGSHLLFVQETTKQGDPAIYQRLFLADADGTGRRELTREPLMSADMFAWSPDSTKIAVNPRRGDGAQTLILVDAATGETTQLPIDAAGIKGELTWLDASGRELLFRWIQPNGTVGIYGIRPDDGVIRTIVPPGGTEPAKHDVQISPDRGTLSYWSREMRADGAITEVIHLVDLGSAIDRAVRYEPTSTGEFRSTFSPDGAKVAFLAHDAGETTRLMLAPVDASALAVVIGQPLLSGQSPSARFSPDGQFIAVGYEENTGTQVIDLTSGAVERIPDVIGLPEWQRLPR